MNEYAALGTRKGFNRSLSHFRMVSGALKLFSQGRNLAELVDNLEKEGRLEKSQIGPMLNALVVERSEYSTYSFNMPTNFKDVTGVQDKVSKWNRFDIIIAYHHPQLGISLINPKLSSHWDQVQELMRQELVVLYLKGIREEERKHEAAALIALKNLLTGDDPGSLAEFNDASLMEKPAAPKPPVLAAKESSTPVPAPPSTPKSAAVPETAAPQRTGDTKIEPVPSGSGKKRMTPKYSVQVTNELFHNGNVEAWKTIIESYKARYSDLDVHIFHDGEKVNDINSLFKWGKVKHGDVLLFSISGENIKGVAKLQRYLFEGASQRFTSFLKKDVNKVLKLF